MRSITPHLTSEFYNNGITAKNVASNNAYDVSTYSELRRIIAKLSYANKDYILFFRGQKTIIKIKLANRLFIHQYTEANR